MNGNKNKSFAIAWENPSCHPVLSRFFILINVNYKAGISKTPFGRTQFLSKPLD